MDQEKIIPHKPNEQWFKSFYYFLNIQNKLLYPAANLTYD